MKALHAILVAVLCMGMVCGIVSAIPITASVTEHSIVWEWQPGTEYMVYTDGIHRMNTTIGRFHMADLRPYEEHRLDLYLYDPGMHFVNATTTLDSPDRLATRAGTSTVTTLSSTTTLYFTLALISTLIFMGYMARATVYGVLMATMALAGSVYLVFITPMYSMTFLILSMMLLVLSITVVIYDIHRLFIASDKGWYFS